MKRPGLMLELLTALGAGAFALWSGIAAAAPPAAVNSDTTFSTSLASSAGAKAAILVPELRRLYLAVSPGEGKTGGGIIWFDVKAAPAS